ncbi:Uncharacterised protein [Yersinia intermedia]|uniref:hypothetical protein n=1 Tax=Yersinia intermedia TaxID=631 RepID=UPI0005E8CC4B|nr:hypothetical protein [Yersinia intermedia]CND04652.1 Uncharacterised protein [Yersinia intermedia]CNH38323.1 Uncharacterised protein [Yersinia intermedia]
MSENQNKIAAEKEELPKKDAMELMKKYSTKTIYYASRKENFDEISYDFLIGELAENALSADVLGRPGSGLNLVMLEINEELDEREAIQKLKKAEIHFLESLESVKKLESLRKREELENTNDIVRSIKIGISRFNILFVILLIIGLTWSALNLPKESLALVSAAIGGAITHLLSERNAVLAMRKSSDSRACYCKDNDQ